MIMDINKDNSEKIKTATVTFHRAVNYGAVLQCYGLNYYLNEKLGVDNYIIDYDPQRTRVIPKPQMKIKSIMYFLFYLRLYPKFSKKIKKFRLFQKNYLRLTKRYYTYDELSSSPEVFDIYITGCDQTFNPKHKQPVPQFFYLNFVSSGSKKISYASSLGLAEVPEVFIDFVKESLQQYSHVSVRETTGQKTIQKLTKKDVFHCLDSVFLLTKNEWVELGKKADLKYKSFILCFTVVGAGKQLELAMNVKKKLGLPVVLVTSSFNLLNGADKIIRDASPQEFLWLFNNASYVVTDSFHGTAFSIIFRKNFFTTIVAEHTSSRITDLLNELNLISRVVEPDDGVTLDDMIIDYSSIEDHLSLLIDNSKNYLKESIFN